MLQKNDLAKQFELLTQQEIKNYQDSLNFVLQSIRELKESVEQVHRECLENQAILSNAIDRTDYHVNNLYRMLNEDIDSFKRYKNDNEVFKKKLQENIGIISDNGIENARKNEFNKNTLDLMQQNIETIEDEMKGHSHLISIAFDNIKHKLTKELARVKEEILSIPSDSIDIKKEFDEKLSCQKVDVEGLLKEINCSKKDCYIMQKKIENIYTLIERLKGEKA